MSNIPSTPADGNFRVVLVPTLADDAVPTLAELNSAAAIDLSCYLTSDGFNPSLDQQVIADSRLCSTEEFERPGRSKRGMSVIYIDNTNTPEEDEFNKAKDTLVPLSKHVLVTRRGPEFDAPFAAGEKVTALPVQAGQYEEMPPEANSVFKISQKLFVTGRNVEVALPAA